jgi:hypothetical protein
MNPPPLHKFAFARLGVAAVLVSIFTVVPRLVVRADVTGNESPASLAETTAVAPRALLLFPNGQQDDCSVTSR